MQARWMCGWYRGTSLILMHACPRQARPSHTESASSRINARIFMHAFMPSAGTVDVRELKIAMRALGFDVKKRQVRERETSVLTTYWSEYT